MLESAVPLMIGMPLSTQGVKSCCLLLEHAKLLMVLHEHHEQLWTCTQSLLELLFSGE